MTELLQNAVASIQLGIEDYQSNDARRPISAVRNFYAGVLLLGKQCLVAAAPDADPMEVLASKFVPVPDGNGGVVHEPKGFRTIDLAELRERFKDFELGWPDGEISTLQKLRNEFEHYHSAAPKDVIRQAIAACFPLIQGFFAILEVEPAGCLGDSWAVMLTEEAFFTKQKSEADATFDKLPWELSNTEQFSCPTCSSSLICQVDPTNELAENIQGRCIACGKTLTAEETVKLVVEAEFAGEDYMNVKDGGDAVINDCPECGNPTYVVNGELNKCFLCGSEVGGECALCSTDLGVHNRSANDSSLCDHCDHMINRSSGASQQPRANTEPSVSPAIMDGTTSPPCYNFPQGNWHRRAQWPASARAGSTLHMRTLSAILTARSARPGVGPCTRILMVLCLENTLMLTAGLPISPTPTVGGTRT